MKTLVLLVNELPDLAPRKNNNGDEEGEENAYAELVEYLRVATQLAYEELAEFREPGEEALPDEAETLH